LAKDRLTGSEIDDENNRENGTVFHIN